jgi:signal transduction histidine kinase
MAASGQHLAERKRVEAVVETLASIHYHGENLDELAHDARNMVTALSLYCDLLEEPGVLTPSHRHYGSELRLLAEASRHLVEKLSALDNGESEDAAPKSMVSPRQSRLSLEIPEGRSSALHLAAAAGGLIDDFRAELMGSRDLLAAIAGPATSVTVTADEGTHPVQMSSENLIRALVNLVKNSAESIFGRGTIDLKLAEAQGGADGGVRKLILTVEDTGYGIPESSLEKIFEAGFTTRAGERPEGGWATGHRGLGLSITRSIVEGAGGRIRAENRTPRGARFVIELPVRSC